MKKNIINFGQISMKLFVIALLSLGSEATSASTVYSVNNELNADLPKPQFQNKMGSFAVDFTQMQIKKDQILSNLNAYFNLDEKNVFKLQREYSDNLGNTYYNYIHLYNSIEVEGNAVFVQTKGDIVQYVRGQLYLLKDLNTTSKISNEEAISIAYRHFGIKENVSEGAVEDMIVKVQTEANVNAKFVK